MTLMITKRLVDITLSLLALLFLLPLFIIIAICIKYDSSGPIFFRQERIGQWNQSFRIFKFRTMQVGAEKQGLLSIGRDRRITSIGHFLRRFKLDELPQLIDVLRGKMSLVGPRPEVAKYVAYYPPEAKTSIFSLKPGLTDLASIAMIEENDLLALSSDPEKDYIQKILPQKIAYYLAYAQSHTFFGDVKILFKTLCRIFRLSLR